MLKIKVFTQGLEQDYYNEDFYKLFSICVPQVVVNS
jgi:hypothetical protein